MEMRREKRFLYPCLHQILLPTPIFLVTCILNLKKTLFIIFLWGKCCNFQSFWLPASTHLQTLSYPLWDEVLWPCPTCIHGIDLYGGMTVFFSFMVPMIHAALFPSFIALWICYSLNLLFTMTQRSFLNVMLPFQIPGDVWEDRIFLADIDHLYASICIPSHLLFYSFRWMRFWNLLVFPTILNHLESSPVNIPQLALAWDHL